MKEYELALVAKDVTKIIQIFKEKNRVFEPTWLMVKRHSVTGLKYFCKTVKYDPLKYQGSGKYWTLHLKKHGRNVETVWYQKFDTIEDIVEFAVFFSDEMNIVESNDWANLKIETGIDGGSDKGFNLGRRNSVESKKLMSDARLGKTYTELMGEEIAKKVLSDKSKKYSGEGNPNALSWTVTNPNGEKFEVVGLRAYCRENNINYFDIYDSRNGWTGIKNGNGKGGRKSGKQEKQKTKKNDLKIKRYQIIDPIGQINEVTGLTQWCRENRVSYDTVKKQRRGWKCKEI